MAQHKVKGEHGKQAISDEKYQEILKGIELRQVRLVKGLAQLKNTRRTPSHVVVTMTDKGASYENRDDQCSEVIQSYVVTVREKVERRQFLKIECQFSLLYASAVKFTDEFFEVFSKANVPINTWPYAREFVDNMTSRLQVPSVTMPLMKKGI